MVESLLTAAIMMAGLGVALAGVLALANKRLYVWEDPRIDEVEERLPGANCGACGEAGCRAFAEKTVQGERNPGECPVSDAESVEEIAAFLGVEASNDERKVARLACQGGRHVARMQAMYEGLPSCRAAAVVAGGGKGCFWGCLGFGDCQAACDFGAITMSAEGLPVVDPEKCTACGACVETCPKGLFELLPESYRLFVACKSHARGEEAEAECDMACTACGRCRMDAAEGLIRIEDNLAVVDYSKIDQADKAAIQRCPTGAIVWFDDRGRGEVGKVARKAVRRAATPAGAAHGGSS